MHKILFTSDTHFFHENIIKSCKRPYVNAEEMNEALIENWNRVVDIFDDVYFLGDFTFKVKSKQDVESVLYRLNGNKYIIKGNHDHKEQLKIFSDCKSVKLIENYFELKINHKLYILFHYPLESWNKKNHGSYHLYGHSHGNLRKDGKEKMHNRLDVGVDVHNYTPISLDEVNEYFEANKDIIDFYGLENK